MDAPAGPRKRRVFPPVYFFAALVAMVVLDRFLPLVRLIESPYTYLGWPLFAAGLVLGLIGMWQFRRAGTTITPFETSSALMTHGVFAFSRNPLYLSMMLGLLGILVVLGSLAPLAVVPVFFLVIRSCFIAAEERMLEETFGDAYRDYKNHVRRWI